MYYIRKAWRSSESGLRFAYLDSDGAWQPWGQPQVCGFKTESEAFANGFGIEPLRWDGDIDDVKYRLNQEIIEVLSLIPPRNGK